MTAWVSRVLPGVQGQHWGLGRSLGCKSRPRRFPPLMFLTVSGLQVSSPLHSLAPPAPEGQVHLTFVMLCGSIIWLIQAMEICLTDLHAVFRLWCSSPSRCVWAWMCLSPLAHCPFYWGNRKSTNLAVLETIWFWAKREVSAVPGHVPVGEPPYQAVLGRTKQVQTIRASGQPVSTPGIERSPPPPTHTHARTHNLTHSHTHLTHTHMPCLACAVRLLVELYSRTNIT